MDGAKQGAGAATLEQPSRRNRRRFNDDRDAQEQASQIQKVNARSELPRGSKALLGKHSWPNPFAECEHGTNAAYNRGLACQSGTFPQMVDGFYAGAMRAQ